MGDLKKAIENRRSCYTLSNKSPLSPAEIKALIDHALLHVPSAYNSQSTRVVLLLGKHHQKLWEIVKEALEKVTSAERFPATQAKVDNCFQAGYGTVLFYEDQRVVREMQERFPTYARNFPVWSEHTSAMHQYAIWMLLEDAGLGASLQHYNPLIDEAAAVAWGIDPDWKLIAQMPFGVSVGEQTPKEFKPLEPRSIMFG